MVYDAPTWKDGEYFYCVELIAGKGDRKVGGHPAVVAQYLRIQATSAFRDGLYETSARLGTAATAISASADNHHSPDWDRAFHILHDD